jgi:hypothetical protein
MVTKRARTWLARGTLITVIAVVGTLGGSTWALSGTVAAQLLLPPDPLPPVTVTAVDAGSVTITGDERALLPGTWSLVSGTGRAILGDIIQVQGAAARRRLITRSGVIPIGAVAALERTVYQPDPAAVGLEFAEVFLEGPLGDIPAWTITGTDDTWVVYVHDFGLDRTEALRVLGGLADLGLSVIIPALPTDPEVREGGSRTTDLGPTGWRNITPAIDFALDAGARDIVLFGSGTGGSSVLLAAEDPRYSALVAALVLDAPLLDPAAVADARLAEDKVPGFLAGWAKALATFRFGIDWTGLDLVAAATRQEHPVLIFHGAVDDRFPLSASEAYAAADRHATLVVVPGAGHGEAWNVDPGAYDAALAGFLNDTVVGPAGGVAPGE